MEKKDRNQMLGEESIVKLLIKFSIPSIVGMFVNALYNIVDKMFLGQVSSLAIGGVHLTFPVSLALMAFSMLIGIGGNSLSSIRLGEGRIEESKKILGNAFILMIFASLSLSAILFFFADPILKILGSTEALHPYSLGYLRILIIGIPFQMIGFGLNFFIRGEGSPVTAMGTMLIGAITNIILDYVFVIKFNWGVEGAAIATVIGQFFSFIWVMLFLFSSRSSLKITKDSIKLNTSLIKEFLALGIAPFGMQLSSGLVVTIFNWQLKTFGDDVAITAMGIVQSLSTLAFMPIFGINQGSQPIMGFNYGAKKFDRVKKTFNLAATAATIYITFCFIIIMLYPEKLIQFFIDAKLTSDTVLDVYIEALRVTSYALPVLGYQILSSNYFQATGKPIIGAILSLSRQLIVLLPILLILPRFFGLYGVWLVYPVSDFISFLVTLGFRSYDKKKLNLQILNENSSIY